MAFRNVFRQKRRSLLTALTIGGGFVLCVMSIGWSDGSYAYIINMFTRTRLGHIQIHDGEYVESPSLYATIKSYAAVGSTAAGVPSVEAWAPRIYAAGLASVENKSAGIRITGIDPAREQQATRFSRAVNEGRPLPDQPAKAAVLGRGLAQILAVQPGGEVVIVSQGADGSIANDVFTVSGIAATGDEMADRTSVYLHIEDAQSLLALPDQAHEIAVAIRDVKKVRVVARQIAAAVNNPRLTVRPWQEFAKAFYEAMQADQKGNWIMLVIVTLLVSVGVLNTVLMSVLERQREYGLLRALGTGPGQIILLILFEIQIIAMVSILAGTAAGVAINYVVSLHGIKLPESFTYGGMEFSFMYAEVNVRSVLIPAATVLVSSLLVSFFPAVKAARTDPAKALRAH